MKQVQSDMSTIAWFKIAECVSRGEKERALGVYRLLSHSFNDSALARQLEADIYLSFDEKKQAIALYRQAAELYEKAYRLREAVSVYEHIITISPADSVIKKKIIELYVLLENTAKITQHIHMFIEELLQSNNEQQLQDFLSTLRALNDDLYAQACIQLQKN